MVCQWKHSVTNGKTEKSDNMPGDSLQYLPGYTPGDFCMQKNSQLHTSHCQTLNPSHMLSALELVEEGHLLLLDPDREVVLGNLEVPILQAVHVVHTVHLVREGPNKQEQMARIGCVLQSAST